MIEGENRRTDRGLEEVLATRAQLGMATTKALEHFESTEIYAVNHDYEKMLPILASLCLTC